MPTIDRKPINYRPDDDNAPRGKMRRAIYDSAKWRALRRTKLQADPLCEQCLEEGRTRIATEVHHRKSFADATGTEARRLAYDYDNLMSLCKECHGRKHAERNR